MSDPVTNVEIEDVLSSIRKLVAEDSRVAPAMPKKEPERLVLTPAQRVKEAPHPEKFSTVRAPEKDGEAELTRAQRPDFPHDLPIEEVPRDARLADFGKVEGAFPDIEALSSPDHQEDSDDASGDDAVQSSARLDLGWLIEQEVAAALRDVPGADSVSDADGDEEFDDRDWTDWNAPDADDDDEFADVEPADVEMVETDVRPVDDTLNHQDAATSLDEDLSEVETHHVHVSPPPLTLEDKVAALGRLVARDANEFEEERDDPDTDELTAVSERMTWPDAMSVEDEPDAQIELEPATEPESNVVRSETAWRVPVDTSDVGDDLEQEQEQEQEQEPKAEAPAEIERAISQPVAPHAPSLQLDEDMLRELVGDIVRQELQGALGERITRNVRKLVRREIHRMLISQEME